MSIKRNCLYCDNEFETTQAEVRRNRGKYCCFEHYQKYIVENGLKKGSNNPLYSKVEKICPVCKKHFFVKQNTLKKGFGIYCSRKCKGEAVMCKEKNPNWNGGEIIKSCEHCGKPIKVKRSAIGYGEGKYCSKKCWGAAHTGINHPMYGADRALEKNPNWNGGTSFEPYCPKWNKGFKRRCRVFYKDRCVICGKTKEELGYNLIVHHVLYDKQVCCKENEEIGNRKFVTLCREHHGETNAPSKRDYWANYFTKLINEKYGGKCYYTEIEYQQVIEQQKSGALA